MHANNPGSYAKFFKNESKTVAYLGYNNIGSFRRLHFHPVCLYWYVAFDTYCGGRKVKTPMSILKNRLDLLYFGKNLQDLLKIYPMTFTKQKSREQSSMNNGNSDHIYAGILHLVNMNTDNSTHQTHVLQAFCTIWLLTWRTSNYQQTTTATT